MSKIESKIEKDLSLDLTLSPNNTDLEQHEIEYDPTGMPNSENAITRAQAEDLLIVYPRPNQLFVDLDNEHSFLLFKKQFDLFVKFIDADAEFSEAPSKSGLPKRHVTVWLSCEVTEEKRILFQALLGSDRVRELLGYVQESNGDPHPTLFLEKPIKLLTGNFGSTEILKDSDIPF